MKIAIVGTSNSVIGTKGYIQALKQEHDVIQLSSGRVPFYAGIKTIVENRQLIESCDLLIIDHYINDVNYYGSRLGTEYREHLELYYQLLASLNVNIVNLLFPMQKLEQRDAVDMYHQALSLCHKYKISIIDLNNLDIDNSFYIDHIHLSHDVSYVLGECLNQAFSVQSWPVVTNGSCEAFPFYIVDAKALAEDDKQLGHFKNSLVDVEYFKLEEELSIPRKEHESLIAIGLLRDKDIIGCSGFSLNGKEWALSGFGYFLEKIDERTYGDITLSPLKGSKEVANLMGRDISRGEFTYCYISELFFIDYNLPMQYTSAKREVKNLNVNHFPTLAKKAIDERDSDFELLNLSLS